MIKQTPNPIPMENIEKIYNELLKNIKLLKRLNEKESDKK